MNQTVEPFEILVIDDGSNPPLNLNLASVNLRVVRFQKEQGLSMARNFGISQTKGDYVAFLDDDTIPGRNWLRAVQAGTSSSADLIGGPLKPFFMAKPPNWWSEKEFGYYCGVGNVYGQRIWGANMVFKRSIFQKIGVFNTRIGRQKGKLLSSEEEPLIRKIRSCYNYSFLPDAEVMHIVTAKRMTLKYLFKWNYFSGKSHRTLNDGNLIKTAFEALKLATVILTSSFLMSKEHRIKTILNLIRKIGFLV